MSTNFSAPDLTLHPPRSPRSRLGGLVILPRILDKGRAKIVGKLGGYVYNSPTDQHLARFLGLNLEALLAELGKGRSDGDILEWVHAHSDSPRAPWEIETWSAYYDKRGPDSDAETLELFAALVGNHSKTREDIKTWFEALELDDYASFGGKV